MLEDLLRRLAALTPVAQQRWEAKQREEDEDYEPDADAQLWLTLERDLRGVWLCGWRVQLDEATDWALHAAGATPTAAAQAMLDLLTT